MAALVPVPAQARPPNIVLLLADNLGYGDIEPFGSRHHRTPSLTRMARQGRKLTHFYASAGVCTPSRASLMTGCYAQRIGLHTNPRDGLVLRPISPYGLHADEVTIAELLRSAGYATAIVGKWHLGDQPEFLPTRHGFDSYLGIPYSDDMTRRLGVRNRQRFDGDEWPPLPLLRDESVIEAPVDRNLLTKRYTEEALRYIDENADRPFFLYLAHAMPGSTAAPFASEAFRGKSSNGPWGDSVEELDWSTGQILDKLVQAGLSATTLVLWTSDNGAPLAPDPSSPARGSNLPLHGRGYTTAEGGFRVPAIAWWPGTIPAGTQSAELMSMLDMLPTLATLAGAEIPNDRDIDGVDVGDALLGRGSARSPRDELYYFREGELQAVRSGKWKLFVPMPEPTNRHPHFGTVGSSEPLLFDVEADVGSQHNLATQHPQVVELLMRVAARARAELGDRGVPGSGQRAPGQVADPEPALLRH
ncbi:MAG: sulfatase [Acidobacteriia bacterium]|nr:sulfatase [Terriglobia bacterium]